MNKFGDDSIWNKVRAAFDDLVEDMVVIGVNEEFVLRFFFEVIKKLFIIFQSNIDMMRREKRSSEKLIVGFTSGNECRVEGFGFIKRF